MSAPELLFLEDGSTLAWSAQDGSLFLAVTDAATSHEHRVVLEVPDIAAMLARTMGSTDGERFGPSASRLFISVLRFLAAVDALAAEDAEEAL